MEIKENNRKSLLKLLIPLLALILLLGGSYAFFNYTRTGRANTLIVGNIYLNHTQGTEINLSNEFPSKVADARARNDNTVTITVTGYNESDRDIYYKLLLNHGDTVDGRDRIRDDLLRFDLIEILANNEEKYLLYNEKFDTINNTIMLKDRVDANTSPSNQVTRTYKLRMWIDYNTLISDTDNDADYTTEEYENLCASVKITAKGQTEKVYYYESFNNAIAAVNDGTYASETNRTNAVTGIYIDADDNTTNLVLYDDAELNQKYTISNPVDINLYGYTLEKTSDEWVKLTINDSFKITNGTITSDEITELYFYVGFNEVSNINYILTGSGALNMTFNNVSEGKVSNCNFDFGQVVGLNTKDINIVNTVMNRAQIALTNNSTINITDSYLYNGDDWIAMNYGKLVIDNSTIIADSEGCYQNNSNNSLLNCNSAINNTGTLIFNSGYVYGVRSAVNTTGGSKIYVYGGTFEGSSYGGFAFSHGPTGVAYIENANIHGVTYTDQGKLRVDGPAPSTKEINGVTYSLEEHKMAVYVSGSSSGNGENVYIVNSNISSPSDQVLVMNGTDPAKKLYMSGCTFTNTLATQYFRVDNISNAKLYFGANNNFGNINNIYNSGNIPFATAKQNGVIVETNANYKNIVRPE